MHAIHIAWNFLFNYILKRPWLLILASALLHAINVSQSRDDWMHDGQVICTFLL